MERYSDAANRVVERARQDASHLNHPYVGTEHLLLGLITVDSPISKMLVSAGATADAARDKAAEAVGRGDHPGSEREFSSRARRALERASRLSLNRRDAEVGPEHLLIGVLDVEGRAGQVLRGLGVDVVKLRDAVEPLGSSATTTAAAASTGHKSPADRMPQCAVCGTELNGALSYRVLPADGQDGAPRAFVIAFCSSCGAALGATGG